MTSIVKRTTLFVRDMEASLAWYQQVLGMSVWFDKPFTLSGIGLAAGKAGDKTRLVILKCEDDVVGMIGLLQWLEPDEPPPEPPAAAPPPMPPMPSVPPHLKTFRSLSIHFCRLRFGMTPASRIGWPMHSRNAMTCSTPGQNGRFGANGIRAF